MTVNFEWAGITCELQIKLDSSASLSRGYYEQHFVYEVRRSLDSHDLGQVVDIISKRVNWLAVHGHIDWGDERAILDDWRKNERAGPFREVCMNTWDLEDAFKQ